MFFRFLFLRQCYNSSFIWHEFSGGKVTYLSCVLLSPTHLNTHILTVALINSVNKNQLKNYILNNIVQCRRKCRSLFLLAEGKFFSMQRIIMKILVSFMKIFKILQNTTSCFLFYFSFMYQKSRLFIWSLGATEEVSKEKKNTLRCIKCKYIVAAN